MTKTADFDVSDELVMDGKANPFGWSAYKLKHNGVEIGEIYCGEPKITDKRYYHTETPEGVGKTRLRVFLRADWQNESGKTE